MLNTFSIELLLLQALTLPLKLICHASTAFKT